MTIENRMDAYREATAGRDGLVRDAAAAGYSNREIAKRTGISRPTVINIVREWTAKTTITPELVRALHEAEFGSGCEAVIGRDEDGILCVEPDATAKNAGHEIIAGASAIEEWSAGNPMSEADYETYARETARELAERG